MAARTYLKVPYIEKDSAKALGAKWDAVNKKWYVPANVDIAPFARWHSENADSKQPTFTTNTPKPRKTKPSNKDNVSGMTYPTDEKFTPYNGENPPWS